MMTDDALLDGFRDADPTFFTPVRFARMLDELGIERVRLHDARHSRATLIAPAASTDRGDCGVAGARERGVHAVRVRPQPGRRAEGRRR
jgi:hypothetical protein